MNSVLENVMLIQLAKKINEKAGTDVASAAEPTTIYENLDKLCEVGTVEEIGFKGTKERKFSYMPKAYKTMLLRLIDPAASVVVDADWMTGVVKDGKPVPDFLRVSGRLYVGQCDRPAATYGKQFSATRLMGKKLEDANPDEVAIAESTARGIVETRLLTSYGIGAWVSGEAGEDPEIQLSEIDKTNNVKIKEAMAEEKKEVAEANGLMDLVDKEPQVAAKIDADEETDIANMFSESQEIAATEETASTATVTEEVPAETTAEPAEKVKRGRPKKGMSVEQARDVVADTGVFDGVTLGKVEAEKPQGLLFVYNNTNKEQVKEAVSVIVKNNTDLNNLFLSKGINL